jgi:hypothetical protein
MLHDRDDDGASDGRPYEPPCISEIGSLQELTLVFNKKGPSHDVYSNIIPIVGSLAPTH